MFYAVIKETSSFPALVVGWDMNRQIQVQKTDGTTTSEAQRPDVLSGYALIPLPDKGQDWWNAPARWTVQYQVDEQGRLSIAPAPVTPLPDQARTALQKIQQQAAMLFAMGQTFGPNTRAYVQKLQAIIEGTDKTSLVLPAAPADATT